MNSEIALLILQLLAVAVLLFLNGFFVSVEFAYVTVPRPRIDQLTAKGNANAALVQHLLADTDRVLAASQIGITMASLGIGWVGESAANNLIRFMFQALFHIDFDGTIFHGIGLVFAFALITLLHVVIGEQVPKTVAIRAADHFALVSARIVAAIDFALRPCVVLLDNATGAVLQLLGVKSLGAHHVIYSVDELKQLVAETQQSGELEPREKEMLHNVFEFEDKLVREVMIPRPEIAAVAEDTTIADFLQTFRDASHARFPIYAGTIDNITGLIVIKDVLRAIATQGAPALDQPVRTLARPAIFVPESKRIGHLFTEMQAQKIQLAIVIDEFGGTAGMAPLEELLEEIVGRLSDELTHEPPQMQTIDERTTQIDAQLRVEEVNEQLHLHLPEGADYETIAGLVLYVLRHIPTEGEYVQMDDMRLTITRMAGPKIEKILITRL